MWRFLVGQRQYEIAPRGAPAERSEYRILPAPGVRAIAALAEDPHVRRVLLRAAEEIGDGNGRGASAEAAWQRLALAFERGQVVLRLFEAHSIAIGAVEIEPVARAPERVAKRTWIEVRLVDEEDKPVAGVGYRIELSDGSLQFGKTDAGGGLRYSDIPEGVCNFSFDLDEQAWEAVR